MTNIRNYLELSKNIESNIKKSVPYVRVGTKYYKKILVPILGSGDLREQLVEWNRATIKEDENDKEILKYVPKYDSFCIVPSHLNYQEQIGTCYNQYRPLPHKPSENTDHCPTILDFIHHIAGKQYHLLMEYIKLLYENPTQKLPILCLVSKEKGTGKSTFVNFLKKIFGLNMTLNRAEDFYSQFNSDWTDKVLVAVEETFFQKSEISEKIKNISTALNYKTEGKGTNRTEVDLFVKIILCTNQEENFIKVEPDDKGRFWVIKVPTIPREKFNPFLLSELEKEIPAFLRHLTEIPYINPKPLTRFWFSPEQTDTEALQKLQKVSDYKTNIIREVITDKFKDFPECDKLQFVAKEIVEILKKDYNINTLTSKQVGEVLKELGYTPAGNTLTYKFPYWRMGNDGVYLMDYDNRIGRYYEVSRSDFVTDNTSKSIEKVQISEEEREAYEIYRRMELTPEF